MVIAVEMDRIEVLCHEELAATCGRRIRNDVVSTIT